ncbi:ERMES complex subunit [Malassezia sp. CBS 17886]|nr:ERMES complex subunit [Malassezia sp. CBS 17886]
MSFNFEWPTFSAEFYEDAKSTLTTALNRGPKPKVIVGDIRVQELHMGTIPPELEILEIGDLSKERFRGIFRLMYAGDAHLEMSTEVQANPLARPASAERSLFSSAAASRRMLFAATPLTVPMRVRLSAVKLRAIVVLVVSQTKGVTLVFKNDPLESVSVSSTFDSIGVIQKYLQEEIEAQLREMFREDLPSIVHGLSQQWLRGDARAAPPPPPTPPPPRRPASEPRADRAVPAPWSDEGDIAPPLALLALEDASVSQSTVAASRLAHMSLAGQSPRGLKDLFHGPRTPPSPTHAGARAEDDAAACARTFHTTSRIRPSATAAAASLPTAPEKHASPAHVGSVDLPAHLAGLLRSNHTLSPYTRTPRHIAVRTAPGSRAGAPRTGRNAARQRRTFRLRGTTADAGDTEKEDWANERG